MFSFIPKSMWLSLSVISFINSPLADAENLRRTNLIPEGTGGLYKKLDAAPAVRVGNTIWISGIAGYMKPGQTYEEMLNDLYGRVAATLKFSGASMQDVVEVVTYTTDDFKDFVTLHKVHAQQFAPKPPAWTAMGVKTLVDARLSIEVKVTAIIGSGDQIDEKWSSKESPDDDFSHFPEPSDVLTLHQLNQKGKE